MESIEKAILWKSRDPYYGLGAEGIKSALRERLADRVKEAWIFGSHATGTEGPDSDLDLILIMETNLPFVRRASLFDDVYDLVPALDLLVYTPQEFNTLLEDRASGFWRSVAATKVRLL